MLDSLFVKPEDIPVPLCQEIIERFENDKRKVTGEVSRGVDLAVKRTDDLVISRFTEWKDIDDILYQKLSTSVNEYVVHLKNNDYEPFRIIKKLHDTGFQIQRYIQNEGFYIWHNDFSYDITRMRIFTYIWYLNTVEEGGETEFVDGTLIKPESGKLLIFPACWSIKHRGRAPLSNNKYIITGWVYTSLAH